MADRSTQPITTPTTRHRRLAVRLIATAVLIIGAVLILRFPGNGNRLPFHQTPGPNASTIVARHRTKLPASLHPGDTINFAAQTRATRTILFFQNVPANHAYPLQINRNGQPLRVTIHTSRAPDDGPVTHIFNDFIIAITMLFALITIWRGVDWIAWGLSIFAFALVIDAAAHAPPLPPPLNIGAGIIFTIASSALPILGLYISAINLVAPSPRNRRRLNRGFGALLLTFTALQLAPLLGLIFFANQGPNNLSDIMLGLVTLAVLIPILVLTIGYLRATLEQKLRLRWFLVGTSLILVVLALGIVHSFNLITNPTLRLVVGVAPALVTMVIFGMFAYAATTQRLIDVRIVVSRAMMVTALISVIVASLGASERLIVSSALGTNASRALELAVALGVGILFHQAQRWIEALIDRLFFWREHKARAALRDFVRDAGFIESADILVTRTVQALAARADATACALFELRGEIMERSASIGTQSYPTTLDPDDPSLVRLRATRAPLDLHGLDSAINRDGVALPLALRGRLFGVIACAPRAAGRYAQSEMDELGQAAHEIGAALFALRARANETLIERLAAGDLALDHAIAEARQLSGL